MFKMCFLSHDPGLILTNFVVVCQRPYDKQTHLMSRYRFFSFQGQCCMTKQPFRCTGCFVKSRQNIHQYITITFCRFKNVKPQFSHGDVNLSQGKFSIIINWVAFFSLCGPCRVWYHTKSLWIKNTLLALDF